MAEIIGAYPAAQRAAEAKETKRKLEEELLREKIAATRRAGEKQYVPGTTAERWEKQKLTEDIIQSFVEGKPAGRFAATTPQIKHFSISDEPQRARPGDWQYIDPKHLAKLKAQGIKSITVEGGGGLKTPSQKKAEAYNLLLTGRPAMDQADPNEMALGRLAGPRMTTGQARETMAAGVPPGAPAPTGGGGQFVRAPIPKPPTAPGMGGGPTDPLGIGPMIQGQGMQGGTDLTQWAQQKYQGQPTQATDPLAIYKMAQAMNIMPTAKDQKLITVYQVNPEEEGPDSMRIPDTAGPPPPGYTYKSPGSSLFGLDEATGKLRGKTGGEGTEPKPTKEPSGEELRARQIWDLGRNELIKQGIDNPTPAQVRAWAESFVSSQYGK